MNIANQSDLHEVVRVVGGYASSAQWQPFTELRNKDYPRIVTKNLLWVIQITLRTIRYGHWHDFNICAPI